MIRGKVSLKEYLSVLQSQRPDPYAVDLEQVLRNNPYIEGFSVLGNSVVYVYDIPHNRYVFMSDSVTQILGYPPDGFYSGSIDFAYTLMHPDDRDTTLAMAAEGFDFFKSLPPEKVRAAKFSLDFRCIHPVRGTIRLLNQISVLQLDPEGKILLTLGTGTDISHLRKGDVLFLHTSASQSQMDSYIYLPGEAPRKITGGLLSEREKQILENISQGRSSKEVGEKLFISAHTVDTHRRKMIEKTHTKDISSLISYMYAIG